MSKNTTTEKTDATTAVTEVTESVAPRSIFAIASDLESLTDAKAQAQDAALANIEADYAEKIATLKTEFDAHPGKATLASFAVAMGLTPAEKAGKASKATGDTAPVYQLANRTTGNPVTDAKGNVVDYVRHCTAVAPSLKEHIGEDLSGYALKNIASGEILADTLTWRKKADKVA